MEEKIKKQQLGRFSRVTDACIIEIFLRESIVERRDIVIQ